MIRRISKKNDLKDIIKSCPSGVIDDIYKIEYYIQGYSTYIEATFSKVNNVLEVILPSSDLETLPNGILMRKAYYKVVDTSYPDGYYNLEFDDNMNIWLGENESETPIIPDYVTEEELSETLGSYATQSWVSSQQFATESWVSEQGYITSEGVSGLATMSWVESQGYLTSVPSEYATESWVSENALVFDTGHPTGYDGIINFNNISGGTVYFLADYPWVSKYYGIYLTGHGGEDGYAGLITIDYDGGSTMNHFLTVSDGYATESWVQSQGYLTAIPSEYATESWVEAQGYITSTGVSGLATMSWVEAQGYITSTGVSGLATMSWVESQGYITTSALSDYATQSWATSQFLEESKVWTGTQSQWEALTPAQQALYTIALVTE